MLQRNQVAPFFLPSFIIIRRGCDLSERYGLRFIKKRISREMDNQELLLQDSLLFDPGELTLQFSQDIINWEATTFFEECNN